jgi:hypothetical protein
MIKGMAMLSCPESAVTIKVAKDATARDHHRLCGADEQSSRRSLIKRAAALFGNSLKPMAASSELLFFEVGSLNVFI